MKFIYDIWSILEFTYDILSHLYFTVHGTIRYAIQKSGWTIHDMYPDLTTMIECVYIVCMQKFIGKTMSFFMKGKMLYVTI